MYLQSINSEKQLKAEYRKKAMVLHPDMGGSELEFVRLTQEYKMWKSKLLEHANDFSQIQIGDTVWVNRTECEITYVDAISFIAKAKGRIKSSVFSRSTGIGKYNAKYRAALMKEYFNNLK